MGYSGAWGKLNKTRKSRGIVPLMHMLRDIWLLALGKQYTGPGVNRGRELQDITNFLSITTVNQNIYIVVPSRVW